jgi:hypothetical protein
MRTFILLGAVTLSTLAGVNTSRAQQAWCSIEDQTTVYCLYYTYEQCLEAVSGVGGYCERNPRYRSKQRQQPPRGRDYDRGYDRGYDNRYRD